MNEKEMVVTIGHDDILASASHGQMVELDCRCGTQLDRSPDEVIWCIVDVARHYRRSVRWAYRIVRHEGFPPATRGDSHRWYKTAILSWNRGNSSATQTTDVVIVEHLTKRSSVLGVDGRTTRPSRRLAVAK
jgi:hypothetical protein